MKSSDWWIQSGLAAEAARELLWFVVLVFVAAGIGMWREMQKDLRNERRNQEKTRNQG